MTKNKNEQKNQDNNNGSSNEKNEPTRIYLTGNSTLQTPEEDIHDKSIDPRKVSTLEPSNDDLHETKADDLAGSDRAGTAERKSNSI